MGAWEGGHITYMAEMILVLMWVLLLMLLLICRVLVDALVHVSVNAFRQCKCLSTIQLRKPTKKFLTEISGCN